MRVLVKIVLPFTLVSLAACDAPPGSTAHEPTLHEVMAGRIDPVADVIWETSSRAYGEDGNAKDGVLTAKDWAAIEAAARDLHRSALVIAEPDIVVVRPGVLLLDEGQVVEAVTAKQVMAYVERDRPGLTRHARDLSQIALKIEAAAKSRDAATTVRLSEELDYVCEGCHQRFWYPEQPSLAKAKAD